ncbi:Protein split ends [Holothuria leucospilota]|uniref:Protein split ends n=1 Tax=Holothuria leucospilota TaxID=206669 RepID=A0A9Q1H5S2_HOLLE|nr:Protein split ends [Holothuria leucospilota]
MPFNLDKFVTSPSVEELDSLKKSEIVKVAKHYGIEFQPLMQKDEIKRYVLEYLVDESILLSTVLETAITVPTDNTFELKRLEMEMNKEIRLKEMEREREREEREREEREREREERERERKEREMQMQKEKEEREMQMQKEKEEREMQMQKEKEEREMQMQREKEAREHEFRLKQLELGVIKGSDPKIGLDTGRFDVSKHVKFVPKFQEDNVEKFFNHFEKLGEQLKWPRDKWSILIQSNFTGKAQEVYSALSIEDSMDYDKVKKAILQAYELVPEAYRQKFRKYRKADTQTYVKFAYQKERHFDRWCASKKVSTFDTLRQLMLVEEFKRCVNDDIKTHLEENKADKLSEVANLADHYALTHKFSKVGRTQNKGQFSRPNKKYGNNSGTTGNSGSQSGSISPTNSGKKQPDSSRQKNDQVSSNKAAFKDISCGFCHKKGHTMANCFTLAKLKETETASNALANVENSSEVVVTLRPNSNDKIKEEYLPFVSEGFISPDGNSAHPPVKIKILRDTGATQSLLLDGVLPLSDSTSTGANVLIQGVECGFISVPLHKINLKSDLVSGSVIVGVRPTLPVKGVSLLLGNDLAGGKVVANAILTDKPCDYNNTEQLEKEFPNLFPACAVTRAMSQKLAMDDNLKHPPSKSEDTVPKSGTSRELYLMYSQMIDVRVGTST